MIKVSLIILAFCLISFNKAPMLQCFVQNNDVTGFYRELSKIGLHDLVLTIPCCSNYQNNSFLDPMLAKLVCLLKEESFANTSVDELTCIAFELNNIMIDDKIQISPEIRSAICNFFQRLQEHARSKFAIQGLIHLGSIQWGGLDNTLTKYLRNITSEVK